MKPRFTLAAVILLLTFTSCHRYYTSSSFQQKAAKHRTVAVLPPQMVITGNLPKKYSEGDILKMEEKDSKLFQEALYSNILREASRSKSGMDISIQPYSNTLALLEKNDISIRESWTKDDQELARLLGVDAVVRTTIQKDRFMSDELSLGISIAQNILFQVSKNPMPVPSTNKTADIVATCTLVSNGETLWNDNYRRESDWSRPANQVVDNITGKFARRFPYWKKA